MKRISSIVMVVSVAIMVLTPPPAAAGDNADPWWAPRLRLKDTVDGGSQGKTDDPAAAPAASEPATPSTPPEPAPILPDSSLTKTIALVRKSPIGSEPNVIAYLDLMSTGQASGAQVNDFAAYVAKRGMPKVAISFQQYALKLQPQNPTLWLNLGTLQRTTGAFSSAETSFKKAITIDPINALAHYNLGAVYDAQGEYDDAIEEYRRALVLDPSLSDPRKNPQVVNNENLLAVELEIYQSQAGALGLPLLQIQKTPPATKATADKK
jgi:tetratricopeptide (TPR) repeat protein